MNSRERVLKAVNFEEPDRIPIDLGAIRASGINAVAYDKMKKRMGINTPTKIHDVFDYGAAHNSPELAIDKKIAAGDGLFFVAINQQIVVGTVMAGYDGHRGWIYSMAVLPIHRKRRIGSALLTFAEKKLSSLGCMKINLQIMDGNDAVQRFYQTNGYLTEKRISMGKLLKENIKNA